MPQNVKLSNQKVGAINSTDDLEYAWDVCKNQSVFIVESAADEMKVADNNMDQKNDYSVKESYTSNIACFKYNIESIIWAKTSWGETGKYDCRTLQTERAKSLIKLSIHPLLIRKIFKASMFDARGHEGLFQNKTHVVAKETYYEPFGWTRYGLCVIGKYENDSWLHPFNEANKNLWWRAFHGTINSEVRGRGNCIDAMASIYKNGFQVGRRCAIGQGICVSPDPSIVESHGYCGIATIAVNNSFLGGTDHGCCMKSFKFMLQVAVRPNKSVLSDKSNNIYWCVLDSKDVRPYGILLKEIPYEKAHENHNAVPITWDAGIFQMSKNEIPYSKVFYD
eukprot:56295_1